MKHILLVIISCFSILLKAQYTINAASAPVAGDVQSSTLTFSSGLTLPASGLNQFWNYSNVAVDTSVQNSVTYTPVSSAPNASLFPSATIAASEGQGNYLMYSVSSSSLGYLGSAMASSSDCAVFSDPIVYMTFPFSNGNSFYDTYAVNNSQFSTTGTVSTIADGTGTLALPGFTFVNVLKAVSSLTQATMFGTSNVIVKSMTHSFYSAVSKFELFSVVTQTNATGTSTVTNLYGRINDQYITGIKKNELLTSFEMFPVPCIAEKVEVKLSVPAQQLKVTITDVFGREIKEETFDLNGETTFTLCLKNIPPGIYYVVLKSKSTGFVRKLIIE